MEKSFCITPANEEMKVTIQAVYLLNAFKETFEHKRSFLQVMADKMPKYNSMEGFNQLTAFWNGRMRNQEINNDVETVLEMLKSE
jgi:hypothetical protein